MLQGRQTLIQQRCRHRVGGLCGLRQQFAGAQRQAHVRCAEAASSSVSTSSLSSLDSASNGACAEAVGAQLQGWLSSSGADVSALHLRTIDLPAAGRPLDAVVAARPLKAGEVALRVPDQLVVTLDRIFESEALAEMLTAGKLSELACLTLYLMYEKKIGRESVWYPFIKELDRQRARGSQAVESPLLWDDEELEALLKGSPVVDSVRQRLAGLEREYQELDAVWFMAGSLFNRYPFDPPTEAFSFQLFKQAFAAVQASVVHLQGVPLARRFAIVPLGPPLLAYSSSCKALLAHNPAAEAVELVVDRDYAPGEPVYAWCGPQPNRNLLLNYGIVDETNPHDKLALTVTLDSADPLFKRKRDVLQAQGLATMQTFQLTNKQPLPPQLLPFMRLGHAASEQQVAQVSFAEDAAPFDDALEQAVACQLAQYLRDRLAAYPNPIWHDLEVLQNPATTPRQKVAARLTKIEKGIWTASLEAVTAKSPCTGAAPLTAHPPKVA